MKIVPHHDDNWKWDHPTGLIAFQHLLKGDADSADNFMFILGRQSGDFRMPRHRHNFDQIRLPIVGDMNLGDNMMLREGEVGYFGEGMPYGPQEDPDGYRLQLVLQFGGASGYGFMSIEQRRAAWAELSEKGKFVGPHYHHPDGRVEWGLNTIWEHVFGTKLKYPRPRYQKPVIVSPRSFHWLPVAGQAGVHRKYLGAFSERGVWVEMLKLAAGATWTSCEDEARRLFFVLSGAGAVEGEPLGRHAAMQAEPWETLRVTAEAEMVLYAIGLPPILLPETESEEYDLEEMPSQALAV